MYSQIEVFKQLTKMLEDMDPGRLGGYRVDLSINIPTLQEAIQFVRETRILDIATWHDDGPNVPGIKKIDMKVVSVEGLLANARYLLERAKHLQIFRGRNSNVPTDVQQQVVVDIYCSVGWNGENERTTASADPLAWRLNPQPTSQAVFNVKLCQIVPISSFTKPSHCTDNFKYTYAHLQKVYPEEGKRIKELLKI